MELLVTPRAWLLAGLLLLPWTSAQALEGDTLRPFVNASFGYDSNIFRFANDAEVAAYSASLGCLLAPTSLCAATRIEPVSYWRYGAGLNLDWKQGRQEVTGKVSADKTRFSRYSDLLDYTGRDIQGEWKWTLGNQWSGLLSGNQLRTLAPYTNQGTGTLGSNLRTEETTAFQADYWFHTEWKARARIEHYTLAYSAASQQFRDRTRNTGTLGLYRLGNTVQRLGVELVDVQGENPGTPGTDFSEHALRLVGEWVPTGKTRLIGRLGYISRTRSAPGSKDYSGPEWRLEANWTPTGKTLLQATLARDLRDSDLGGASFEVADSLGLNANWQFLPKTRLQAALSYERVDYNGVVRQDSLWNSSLAVVHEAWRGGEVSAGVQRSIRSSTNGIYDFASNALFLNANLTF